MKLFHISLDQKVSVALVLNRFHASLMEILPEGLPCHKRWSLTELSPMEIELVERDIKSFNYVGSWVGICQELSTMISATKSDSENLKMGNLVAIES